MDGLHKVLKWVDHNRKTVLYPAGLIAVCVIVFFIGCAPKTWSLKDVTAKVTEQQFEAEYIELAEQITVDFAALQGRTEALEKRAELGREHIAEIKAAREAFLQGSIALAQSAATGEPITPAKVAGTAVQLLGLLGIGYGAGKRGDTKRKDSEILKRDEQIAALEAKVKELAAA